MVKIFVCGDIVNRFSKKQFIDRQLIYNIKATDYAIGNFEGTLLPTGYSGKDMIQDPSTLISLKDAGFNMLLLANNHIMDYGIEGLRYTINKLDSYNFAHIGAGFSYNEAYNPYIVTINNIKFGFMNLCEAQIGQYEEISQNCGYAWIGDSLVEKRIKELKENVNFVIIFVHAGLEKCVLPLQQFRNMYRKYCDWGADCVIGGHPHVAQGIEKYKNSYIFYSLGNFYFPMSGKGDNILWNNSFSLILCFDERNISFKIVKHKIDKLNVCLSELSPIDVDALSQLLYSPIYEKELADQNEKIFNSLVMGLYREAINGSNQKSILKREIKYIYDSIFVMKSKKQSSEVYRMKLLRHLTRNETYRYLTISALTNKIKEY